MEFRTYMIMGEEVVIPIPRSYRDCLQLVKSDSYRHNGRRDSMLRVWLSSFSRISIRFSFWFRLSQHKGWAYPFTRLMLKRFKRGYGIFVSPDTVVGAGLNIQHLHGIVINRSAVIANNVHIGQFLTIGSGKGRAAYIGNNVYIGPGVSTVDDVEIGNGAIVGAGAVVTKNVESRSVVGGVPAARLRADYDDNLNRNRYPLDRIIHLQSGKV